MIDDEPQPLPRKRGRPSRYTKKLAAEICQRLATGEALEWICEDDHMPASRTVSDWKRDHPDFSADFGRARDDGFDAIAQRTRRTARGHGADQGGDSKADVQRDKLIIETDLKLLAKWDPRRYGDKVQLKHSGAVGTFDPSKLSSDALTTLVSVLEQSAAGVGDAEDGERGTDEASG